MLKNQANCHGSEGYPVCFKLAEDNLTLGMDVIADAVNPVRIAHDAWQQTADNASTPIINIEVIFSDIAEHKKRIESRQSDASEAKQPPWKQVQDREYEPIESVDLRVDTSLKSPEACLQDIINTVTPHCPN